MPEQIELYETGARRVPPAYLLQLTRFLGVPLPYFFESLQRSLGQDHEATLEKLKVVGNC
jgi:hypothetical protein